MRSLLNAGGGGIAPPFGGGRPAPVLFDENEDAEDFLVGVVALFWLCTV